MGIEKQYLEHSLLLLPSLKSFPAVDLPIWDAEDRLRSDAHGMRDEEGFRWKKNLVGDSAC